MSFREDAIAVVLSRGRVTNPDPDWTYSWRDYRADEHFRGEDGCSLHASVDSELVEYLFSEFTDTFTGNRDRQVLAVTHCHCTCGLHEDVTVGVVGTIGELLGDVLGIRQEHRW